MHLPGWQLEEVLASKITQADQGDWLFSLHRTLSSFKDYSFLRTAKRPFDIARENGTLKALADEAADFLKDFVLATVYEQEYSPTWLFVRKINLAGKDLNWHPLLSDYLIAFVLSTILRYQPELLEPTSKTYFLAEAWCNQAPVTAIRYFLMLFTNPPLRIMTH